MRTQIGARIQREELREGHRDCAVSEVQEQVRAPRIAAAGSVADTALPRHLIADHLGWFKDSDEARTVEGIVAAHGGRVRRGSLRDNGETLEIDSDEGEGEGAGIGERVPDAQPGADDDKWWKKPK